MSVLRDFMDKVNSRGLKPTGCAPEQGPWRNWKRHPIHHPYHHNISFRFPTVPPWYRGRRVAPYAFRISQAGIAGGGETWRSRGGMVVDQCSTGPFTRVFT